MTVLSRVVWCRVVWGTTQLKHMAVDASEATQAYLEQLRQRIDDRFDVLARRRYACATCDHWWCAASGQ